MEPSPHTIRRVILQTLRIRILIVLDRVYPSGLDDVEIRLLKSEPPGLREIRRELHYLSEKGLVSIKANDGDSLHVAITARGRDLVMGEIEEIGIASAESYGYTGK